MTKELAIAILSGDTLGTTEQTHEAAKMAVEALQERKTGHWIYDENGMDWNLPAWVCSECHARNDNIPVTVKFSGEYKKITIPYRWEGSKFCPNCGAKMEETE